MALEYFTWFAWLVAFERFGSLASQPPKPCKGHLPGKPAYDILRETKRNFSGGAGFDWLERRPSRERCAA